MSLEDEIETIVRRVVDERLRAVRLNPPTEYTGDHLPPDLKSRDAFHRLAKLCPGARRVGRGWLVPIDAWRAFRAAKNEPVDVSATVAKMIAGIQ